MCVETVPEIVAPTNCTPKRDTISNSKPIQNQINRYNVSNLETAFELTDDHFYREFLIATCRQLLHSNKTQEFGDMSIFLGHELVKMLDVALADGHWSKKMFASLVETLMVMSLERGMTG